MSDFTDLMEEDDFSVDDWDELAEVRCKYCRQRGLAWMDVNGHRRLVDMDTGAFHVCHKPSPSDFDNLDG